MGKDKLRRWKELEDYEHVIQPELEELIHKDHYLKGQWRDLFFKNQNSLVLELGCGKGEYSVDLARKYPQKNFIGVDIKGARIWRGAKTAYLEGLLNVGFLRTRIEFICALFAPGEVDEIWITFPDPRGKRKDTKKRLTGSRFLNKYKKILRHGGIIHLKTDNFELFMYTRQILIYNQITILTETRDLYKESSFQEVRTIQTFYEQKYLENNQPIFYLKFSLSENSVINELPSED